MRSNRSLSSVVALSLGFSGLLACNALQSRGGAGSAEVIGSTSAALSSADVVQVTLTITGPGLALPAVSNLSRAGSGWQGDVTSIPAGTGYDFHADAYDATNALVFTGDAQPVAIVVDQTAEVDLVLQQATPSAVYADDAPIIDGLSASSAVVAPGAPVSLSVTATDATPGDTLTYAWSSTGGTFDNAASKAPTWTAPGAEGTQTLTITVTDSQGASAAMSFQIDVQATTGGANVSLSVNTWPVVTAMTAVPSQLDVGQTSQVSAIASDADGDPLTYAWASTCAGVFANANSAQATFTLAALPASGMCTLSITVDDGRGGTTTGSLGIATGPAPQPVFGDAGTSPDCTAPQTMCGAVCTNTSGDVNNCGTCDLVCASGDSCEEGACVAPPPYVPFTCASDPGFCNSNIYVCNTITGRCVGNGNPSVNLCTFDVTAENGGVVECGTSDAMTSANTCEDPNNCGNCGIVCPSGVCTGGFCE